MYKNPTRLVRVGLKVVVTKDSKAVALRPRAGDGCGALR
jgi:hypothetical protein